MSSAQNISWNSKCTMHVDLCSGVVDVCSGVFGVPCAHVCTRLCLCWVPGLWHMGAPRTAHGWWSVLCTRVLGTVGAACMRVLFGQAHVECLHEGWALTWCTAHGYVSEQCVSECVGRNLYCVCTCSPCAASPTGSHVGPPPWPACVVGASGPRGREAAAGGCGQDGLDLFR